MKEGAYSNFFKTPTEITPDRLLQWLKFGIRLFWFRVAVN